MTLATQWITADEFATWPDEPGRRQELIRGEVESMPLPGGRHAAVTLEISAILRNFVKSRKLGRVFAEVGFVLRTDPDTVRGPDVAFIGNERLARIGDPNRFVRLAPDLVVEVASPNDRAGDIADKIDEWLSFGVAQVWQVHPDSRTVQVHRLGCEPITLQADDTLDGGSVLPGFRCRVGEFFE